MFRPIIDSTGRELHPDLVVRWLLNGSLRRLLAARNLGIAPLTSADTVALSDAERQRLARLLGEVPITTFDLINLECGPKE